MDRHANPLSASRRAQALAEAAASVRRWIVPAPEGARRVLIFAQGRSGSTLLESLLASTGHFRVNDEPLMGTGKWVLRPTPYVIGLSRDPARQGPEGHFVCHVKIDHLTAYRRRVGRKPVSPAAFLKALCADGWSILALRRENRVRQVISSLYALQRGAWHKRDEAKETLRLTVDVEEMTRRLATVEALAEAEAEALAEVPHLSLSYERDLLDPDRHAPTVDKALAFIGLDREREVTTPLKKIITSPLPETIANYPELHAWLEALGYLI